MLRRVRRRVFTVLHRAGLLDAFAHTRWRGRRLLILCYHGVSLADEHEWNNQLYISPALFRERLEILRRGRYNVLPLHEALRRLAARTLPPRSVAITFDDGACDFHARAYPLLREYGYPATVYQTTYYCEFQRPVFDTAASYLLWRGAHTPTVAAARGGGSGFGEIERLLPGVGPLDLSTEHRRRAAALHIRECANAARLSGVEKDDLLRRIAAWLRLDYDAIFSRRLLFLMTPDELREVAAGGVDVQLHTHRHRTPADRVAFLREIDDNRGTLERILGPGRREHFCYPSGVYEPPFPGWLREAGVRSATTCDFRLASAADDAWLLPRLVDTGNIVRVELEAALAGVADLVPHRRTARSAHGSSADRGHPVGRAAGQRRREEVAPNYRGTP